MSGSLYLSLRTDTCVAVWNRDNTILNMTCQVTSNIWKEKTIKKPCQHARVQDEHWEVEKGMSTWKMSGWEPALLQSMWWFSRTINQNFTIIKVSGQKKKGENTKMIFLCVKKPQTKQNLHQQNLLGRCNSKIGSLNLWILDHTSSNSWKQQKKTNLLLYLLFSPFRV